MIRVRPGDKARYSRSFVVYRDGDVKVSRFLANIWEHIREHRATGVQQLELERWMVCVLYNVVYILGYRAKLHGLDGHG